MLLEIRSLIHPSHLFPIYVMMITCFLATITGLLTAFRKGRRDYLKWLTIYCILSLLQSILCLFHYLQTSTGKPFLPIHTVSANIFMLIEFFIIFRYLRQSLYHSLAKKIIKWIQVGFPLFCIIYWTCINSFLQFAHAVYIVEALCIFPFCLYYYYEIFTLPYLLTLGQESPFWINTGMAFHFMCFVPLFMLSSFPAFSQSDMVQYTIILSYSARAILYGIFIRGFLCDNPEEKVYKINKYML